MNLIGRALVGLGIAATAYGGAYVGVRWWFEEEAVCARLSRATGVPVFAPDRFFQEPGLLMNSPGTTRLPATGAGSVLAIVFAPTMRLDQWLTGRQHYQEGVVDDGP